MTEREGEGREKERRGGVVRGAKVGEEGRSGVEVSLEATTRSGRGGGGKEDARSPAYRYRSRWYHRM